MAFEEFRKSLLKIKCKRNHKIKNSIGVRDAHKWIRQNKWLNIGKPVSEKEFYKIIRTINNLIADELIKGNEITLPERMGHLEIRKYDTYVKLVNGKIKTNRGIDWDATLKLWYKDEEAKENKVLIKTEDTEAFTIYYNRNIANYPNKTIYKFKPNRALRLAVRNAGKKGNIDAYKIGL